MLYLLVLLTHTTASALVVESQVYVTLGRIPAGSGVAFEQQACLYVMYSNDGPDFLRIPKQHALVRIASGPLNPLRHGDESPGMRTLYSYDPLRAAATN